MSHGPTSRVTFASAISGAPSTSEAQREVLDALLDRLGGAAVDLVVVFATMHHQAGFKQLCADLQAALGPRVILGCTCGGVIGVRREEQRGPGLSVLAGSMPGAALRGFSYEQLDWPAVLEKPSALRDMIDLSKAGGESGVGESGGGESGGAESGGVSDPGGPCAILLLADPFSTPMVKLLPAFASAFGPVPVFGGMASGAQEAGLNRMVLNGEAMRNGAVGVAIGGDIDVQTTVSQGCRAIGEPMVITRSRRHVVQELGGRNPLAALRQMVARLDPADRELLQHNGLHVGRVINEYKGRFGRGDFLIREMVDVDADDGYIAIGDPRVRTGQTVQFHVRDARSAADDFKMMLSAQKVHGQAHGALLFCCSGRGEHLFDHPHADASMVYDALGDAPLAGFFCAGEIGPVGGQSYIHGHTACLAVFRASG
jgi:small ligand-binding sensory domain FIST